ncbi:MAG: 1,4-dihydroxy-2-naphthoate octaprenyltransferase [bacterium]
MIRPSAIPRFRDPAIPRPAPLAVWLRAVRPFSFTASATPVVVGSAAAFAAGQFHAGLFLAALIASVAIHAGANLANDYYDHVRGVDTAESVGPSGVIQQGILSARTVLAGALVAFAVGGALGLWLIAARGWPILAVGVASILAGYAYTGGPVPLGYVGLGDAVVFVFMGLTTVMGAYYVQTGTITATAGWAAIPIAALVTAILVVNNIRDLEPDRRGGKRTLATFIGRRASTMEYLLLLYAAYGAVVLGVIMGVLPVEALVVLTTIPLAIRVWTVVRDEAEPRALTRGGLRGTALLHLAMGLLLALAFLVSS